MLRLHVIKEAAMSATPMAVARGRAAAALAAVGLLPQSSLSST